MARTRSEEGTGVVLPRWFLLTVSGVVTVAAVTVLPWVIWQTRVTMRLEVQMELTASRADKIDSVLLTPQRIDGIDRRLEAVEAERADLLRRLQRLELRAGINAGNG